MKNARNTLKNPDRNNQIGPSLREAGKSTHDFTNLKFKTKYGNFGSRRSLPLLPILHRQQELPQDMRLQIGKQLPSKKKSLSMKLFNRKKMMMVTVDKWKQKHKTTKDQYFRKVETEKLPSIKKLQMFDENFVTFYRDFKKKQTVENQTNLKLKMSRFDVDELAFQGFKRYSEQSPILTISEPKIPKQTIKQENKPIKITGIKKKQAHSLRPVEQVPAKWQTYEDQQQKLIDDQLQL